MTVTATEIARRLKDHRSHPGCPLPDRDEKWFLDQVNARVSWYRTTLETNGCDTRFLDDDEQRARELEKWNVQYGETALKKCLEKNKVKCRDTQPQQR